MMGMRGASFGRWAHGLVLCLLLWGCIFPCLAQTAASSPLSLIPSDKPISAYFREVWTTRQGLPHNQINAIAQTPDGYLWLGTWEGLVRYNGLEFQLFDRSNTPELQDNGVRSLSVAADGAVVVGTSRGGVSIKRGNRWQTWRQRDGLAQDEIMTALQDRQGRLWAGTESMGLTLLDHGTPIQFNVGNGRLPDNVVFSLFEDADGSIWAGTAKGLVHIDAKRPDAVVVATGLPSGPILNLFRTRAGVLLVGTERGVFQRIGQSAHFERLSTLLPNDGVPSITEDHEGQLWVGTINNGLYRWADNRVEHYTSRRELPNNRVTSLLVDKEGSIWAGTNAGLIRLGDAPFTTWNRDQGLTDDYVRAVAEAKGGGIWIGTGRGLNLWRNNAVVEQYTKVDGLPGDSILSLLQAHDGSLWMGTYTDGVLRLRDGRVVERHDNATGMPGSNQVRALIEDRQGALWIGTTRGLLQMQNGRFRMFGLAQGLPREYVYTLMLAHDDALWVGTTGGVARIVGDRVETLDTRKVLDAQDVFGFHEDADGTVWMVSDRGLLRYRNGQLRGIGIAQGLPVDTLFAIVDDGLGDFWLTSNRGVLRASRANIEAVMDGRIPRLTFDHYGEADGLVSAQCNGNSGPSALLDRYGNIWVATARGAAMVTPAALRAKRDPLPQAVLEGALVDGQPLPLGTVLRLRPGAQRLELRFVAPSFLMARFLRYRYRLVGSDAGWIESGGQRLAQYTNIKPGNYRFEVNVSAPGLGQDWSPEVTNIQVEIMPYFWQRRSFVVTMAVLGAFMLYAGYYWRVGNLRRRARRLEAKVAQRTAALRDHAERLRISDTEKSALLAQLQAQSEAFEQMALQDALTGVGNRRSLDAALQEAFARALRSQRPLSFALFDIDHFKQINDRYSHLAGDHALVAVAKALTESLDGAGLLARWGGEEFAVLFERVPLARAREICEAMRERVAQIDCSDYAPGSRLTISVGVAERGDSARCEDLVARADAQLYAAKRAGRNRVEG